MKLPATTVDNRKINYRLFRTKSAFLLTGDNIFANLNIEDNELFICMPENLAIATDNLQPINFTDNNVISFESKKNNFNLEANTQVSAPIYIPDPKDLIVYLVKGEAVSELEKCRSDEMKFFAIMWTFVGAVLGIVINWVTANPTSISITSIVTLSLFLIMSGIMWTIASDFKKRADKVNDDIARSNKNSRQFPKI